MSSLTSAEEEIDFEKEFPRPEWGVWIHDSFCSALISGKKYQFDEEKKGKIFFEKEIPSLLLYISILKEKTDGKNTLEFDKGVIQEYFLSTPFDPIGKDELLKKADDLATKKIELPRSPMPSRDGDFGIKTTPIKGEKEKCSIKASQLGLLFLQEDILVRTSRPAIFEFDWEKFVEVYGK